MTPVLDVELLRTLVAVVDHGGFTRAARALARSQSAVSMQIRRLEDLAGGPLLVRATNAVFPTLAGELLLGYARPMLGLNDQAVAALRRRRIEGEVRIGCMDDYATRKLPDALAVFARMHPQVHVSVETGLTGSMVPRLGADFDLVVAMHPQGSGQGEVLRLEAPVWAAAPRWRLHREDVVPLALYPQGCLFRAWATAALDEAGRRWRMAYVSPSLAAAEAAAAAGLAVTVAKAGTLRADLRILPPEEGLPPLPMAEIVLHRAPGLSPAAAALAEVMVTHLGADSDVADGLS